MPNKIKIPYSFRVKLKNSFPFINIIKNNVKLAEVNNVRVKEYVLDVFLIFLPRLYVIARSREQITA